jgi:hypothetical protein
MGRLEVGSHRDSSLPITHLNNDVGWRAAESPANLLELEISRTLGRGLHIQRRLRHDEERQAETDHKTGRK